MKHESGLFDRRDPILALALLTRLPVPIDPHFAQTRGAAAAWAYPLAGAVVALIAAAVGWLALSIGLPSWLAAGLLIATQILITGAMHEDGLADSADGLWGGWTRTRRLEIMKDSHIGTYGVLSLVLSVLLRWAALASLMPNAPWVAILIAAITSRAAMVTLMAALPHARADGLARSVGRPQMPAVWAAIGLTALTGLVLIGPEILTVIACAGLATLICCLIAHRKVGGQTGDILGATQQIAEITTLITLAALLS